MFRGEITGTFPFGIAFQLEGRDACPSRVPARRVPCSHIFQGHLCVRQLTLFTEMLLIRHILSQAAEVMLLTIMLARGRPAYGHHYLCT